MNIKGEDVSHVIFKWRQSQQRSFRHLAPATVNEMVSFHFSSVMMRKEALKAAFGGKRERDVSSTLENLKRLKTSKVPLLGLIVCGGVCQDD